MSIVNIHGTSYKSVDLRTLSGIFCGESLIGNEGSAPISTIDDSKGDRTLAIPQRFLPERDYAKVILPYIAWAPFSTETFNVQVGSLIASVVDNFRYTIVSTRFAGELPVATIAIGTNDSKVFKGILTFLVAMEVYLPEAICLENHDGQIKPTELSHSSIHPRALLHGDHFVAPPQITIVDSTKTHTLNSESKYGFTGQKLKAQLATVFGTLPRKLEIITPGVYRLMA